MKVEVEMSFVTLKNPRAIIVVTVFNVGGCFLIVAVKHQ